ncbi:type II toxin-antitoxin system HipA family toxin [Pseudooceanicola nanhaiensis]|uniref:type II toxin-antitoxin system HipA family toxin n=1 Tax=Pseudooceanicola nanhaiensis TaxID=375761 RepID=UPI0035160E08
MTDPKELFVWTWLPTRTVPTLAGRVATVAGKHVFEYAPSYLEHEARPIFDLDLPLRPGRIDPPAAHHLAPSLRDALPDRWGRRVLARDLPGARASALEVDDIDEMDVMLRSGSDRIGALDFQISASDYVPRECPNVALEDLMGFADAVDERRGLPPALDRAIVHATSAVGGARPKALVTDHKETGARKLIAKFSSAADTIPMVKSEFMAMRLAAATGLDVAPVELTRLAGRAVLLVERFDRAPTGSGWARRGVVSALTWTQEHELAAHHISYQTLATLIIERFVDPLRDLRELFARMTFNILVGNTDDHARNHAAFFDGVSLSLTPAYDIAPQQRRSTTANQALVISGGSRAAQLVVALDAAPAFQLSTTEARDIIAHQVAVIRRSWLETCEAAELTIAERRQFQHCQFLPPYAFEGYGTAPTLP